METLEILQTLWFYIIGIFLCGYSILDGFDLGIGSLFPFLAKSEEEKEIIFKTIGPIWDGNEVWIITGGASLFAAFPLVYATVFSGFYIALMLVLFALIFRAVSIEFWTLHVERRAVWQWAFTIGSLLPSILFGVALGNLVLGIPLDVNSNYAGSFFTLLRPFPLIIGLLGFSLILIQGCSFIILKTTGAIQERAKNIASKVWIGLMALFILSIVATFIFIDGGAGNILSWIFTIIGAAALIMYRLWLNSGKEFALFLLSSLSIAAFWGIAGSQLFPNLVNASSGAPLSIYNPMVSSTELTLTVMTIIASIGMPIVITYSIFVYRLFKGKTT